MAALTTIALSVAAAAAVAGTAVTIDQARQAKKAQEKQEKNYKRDAAKAEADMIAQQRQERMNEFNAEQSASRKQSVRQRQVTEGGRQGTILTNPLAQDSSNTQTKTLLGS